ncbi:hypothetical protein [Nocardia grenadensis]
MSAKSPTWESWRAIRYGREQRVEIVAAWLGDRWPGTGAQGLILPM